MSIVIWTATQCAAHSMLPQVSIAIQGGTIYMLWIIVSKKPSPYIVKNKLKKL